MVGPHSTDRSINSLYILLADKTEKKSFLDVPYHGV